MDSTQREIEAIERWIAKKRETSMQPGYELALDALEWQIGWLSGELGTSYDASARYQIAAMANQLHAMAEAPGVKCE